MLSRYPYQPAPALLAVPAVLALPSLPALLALLALLVLAGGGCDAGVSPRPGLVAVDGRVLRITDGGDLPDGGIDPTADHGTGPAPDAKIPGPGHDATTPPPPPKPKPDAGPVTPTPGDYDYTKHIKLTSIASTGGSCSTATYGTFYCDVMLHTQSPYLGSDTLTNVHESQHFMAHEHDSSTAAADKFIYLKNGQGAFWPEPKLLTQGIWDAIKHQGTTYNTYIASRPTQPLGENIVDEWRAYLTEEIVAIQMAAIKGQKSGISGLVLGGVEFLYYNAAALHALKTKEPTFLSGSPQAVAIFAMLAEEARYWTIDRGLTVGLWSFPSSANAVLAELRTGTGSAPIRATLQSLYGPVWTKRVLGF